MLGFSAGYHTTRGVLFLLGRFFLENAECCSLPQVLGITFHASSPSIYICCCVQITRKITLNRLFTACHQQLPASSVAEETREESSRPPACVV
jgi:hypothetical protein